VEAQGGRVGVESTLGAGSLFFAVLPRIGRLVDADRAGPDRARARGGLRVLVIDDDAADRAGLVQTLTDASCTVETARTGPEALALARLHVFDVIMLGVRDPRDPGVLPAIPRDGPNRETPVILVTETPAPDHGVGFPVHDVLVKPVPRETLLASLRRASAPPAGSGAILVVDDDPRALVLAEKALRELGYRAVCRSDAEGALEAAGEDPPAAVVLDLLMPDVDGFEFLRRLRWSAGGRRTPVIVWTMKELSQVEREKLAATAQVVVSKDQGLAALIEQVQARVPRPLAGGHA
jgi:CheY-like chemotaxis protein